MNQTGQTADNQPTPGEETPLPICSICHSDPPVNGVQLECGHIFCYLCIKSASEITGHCALCRTEIGWEFRFQEHKILGTMKLPSPARDGNYWFYEGYRGWWLYDADSNRSLEEAFQRGESKAEIFIAGSFYVIDLVNLIQRRKDDEDGRLRKVCRSNLHLENILGMAGLKGQDFEDALEMMRDVDDT